MTTPANSPQGHTPTPFPVLKIRGKSGSSSGFEIGYWCRITRENDGTTLRVHHIPDPKGEFWIVVADIPGIGSAHENREMADFIVRACNSHARLVAALGRAEDLLRGASHHVAEGKFQPGTIAEGLRIGADEARAALASAKQL